MPKAGPRTPNGKAASRRNAWKHGIRSEIMAISPFEDHDEWEAHRDGIVESLQPEGHLENTLAERVAIALWKLRRLEGHQLTLTLRFLSSAAMDVQIAEAYRQGTIAKGIFPKPDEDAVETMKSVRSFPPSADMLLVIRYETHYHRLLIQTLHELEAMQTRRKGGSSPLARLDITGAPGG